jgi:hypothetical protein
MLEVTGTSLKTFLFLLCTMYACKTYGSSEMVQHPTQLGSTWICCGTFFQDDTFLNLDIYLASRISGHHFLWGKLSSCVFCIHPARSEKLILLYISLYFLSNFHILWCVTWMDCLRENKLWRQKFRKRLPLFHKMSYRKPCLTYLLGWINVPLVTEITWQTLLTR